jgi:cell division septation protein DedD
VTHEDGFHEIQLNGKQLVFLFMAVTVVSVVIFLCGVLVGRGVRLDRGGPADAFEAADTAPPPPAEVAGTPNTPVAVGGDVKYPEQLEGRLLPTEKIPPAGEPPPPKAEPVEEPAPPVAARNTPVPPAAPPAAAPAPKVAEAANPVLAEPAGPGVAVQVSAFRVRGEADALATRLVGKGYKAYVVPPAPGAPALFRVRVGKFKDQREADRVAERLKKEEQFDPWIVR